MRRGVCPHVSFLSDAYEGSTTYREDPLKGKRYTPRPLIITLVVTVGGSGNDDAANRPRHLQSSGTSATKRQRHNFGSICGSVGDEEAPGNTFQGLADDEKLERIGLSSCQSFSDCRHDHVKTYEERDEDGGIHQDERQDSGPTVAETVRNWTGKEHTDESTALTGLEEGRLPFGGNGEGAISKINTVALLEGRLGDEIAVEKHIERFHDL